MNIEYCYVLTLVNIYARLFSMDLFCIIVASILFYSQICDTKSYSKKIKPFNRTHFEIDVHDIVDVNKRVDVNIRLTIYETSGVIGKKIVNKTNMKESMINNVNSTDLCSFKLYHVLSNDMNEGSVHHLTSFLWEPWNYSEVKLQQ